MNRTLVLAFAAALAAAPVAVLAQDASSPPAQAAASKPAPKTYDIRDGSDAEMQAWINDPNVHAFYQMTVDAFAQGVDRLDRAAYEKRSHEIFRALAISRNIKPEALEDHLKLIPDQMVQMVARDPKTLASYDNFVVALFGPQKSGPGSIASASH
jgi:hypothetical protein